MYIYITIYIIYILYVYLYYYIYNIYIIYIVKVIVNLFSTISLNCNRHRHHFTCFPFHKKL